MSSNYSSPAYKTSSQDKNLDDLLMLGLDTNAPDHSNLNISLALNSFESPLGGSQFTCDPLANRENLSDDDVQYGEDENNYIDIDVEMFEDIESGEEASSVWKRSPSSSVATEDRSDYDPSEPSDWESDASMEGAEQSQEKQLDSSARAHAPVRVKRSWPARFTEVAGVNKKRLLADGKLDSFMADESESDEEPGPFMMFLEGCNEKSEYSEEEQSDASEDSSKESSSDDSEDSDDSDESEESDSESSSSSGSYCWSESSEDDQLTARKRSSTSCVPLEDTIDIENPYHLHPEDQRFVQHEIFLFWYPEVDIEAHRKRMAGRMVRSTFYQGELRIIMPTLWVVDMHDEGRRNLVGSFEIWGITVFVWLSHRFNRQR